MYPDQWAWSREMQERKSAGRASRKVAALWQKLFIFSKIGNYRI
jgi:hypothetical protein